MWEPGFSLNDHQDSVKKTTQTEDLREKDAEYLDIPAFLRKQED
jgi:hypothetical protein